MICEKCQIEHDGTYGSGRFCSSKCARSFSTHEKREDINKQVSSTLKEWSKNNPGLASSRLLNISDDRKKQIAKKRRESYIKKMYDIVKKDGWSSLSHSTRRKLLLYEQNNKCAICGIKMWMKRSINLHLDHINGDRSDNSRENNRMICPNCHSQTDTYCSKNIPKRITDEEIEKCIIENDFKLKKTIDQLNIAYAGRNFYRCAKIRDRLIDNYQSFTK